ncbi:unnamed protein product [Clonostachys solani]|uniref:Zn(2)-C6 fungal-type domain-containing protein n=1 Tax=Clonostachys solani TaxID=160281 RepID=A0A9N9ZN29_9HYPO|nr:unnamed protein product [Clonostachys solani]
MADSKSPGDSVSKAGGRAGGDADHANKRQRTAAMYQRKRAVTACQPCRLRKTRCDNVRPTCGFCSKNGAQCTYPEANNGDYSTFDPASLAILDRINHVVSLLETQSQEPVANDGPSASGSSHAPHHSSIPTPADSTRSSSNLSDEDILLAFDVPDFPSSINNCESILRWPVFEGLVPDIHSFVLDLDDTDAGRDDRVVEARGSLGRGVQEDDFISLSKRFLAYVHVKNPILDVSDYKNQVRIAAENGPRWDGQSCLVLISCALACLSAPFQSDITFGNTPESVRSSISAAVDPDTAAMYYLAAKKRLGIQKPCLLYIQCLFLCGVYEMYTLSPLQAWFYFNRACVDLRNLLWARNRRRSPDPVSQEARRLEQRLYWSCVKTEYELRCEIPLPPSGITNCDYPDMFPSPPTRLGSPTIHGQTLEELESDIVPEEEKSWFYYLAEISYRRIMNRAMAVMGHDGEEGWVRNISSRIKPCKTFSDQIDLWYSHVPPQLNPQHEGHENSELGQFLAKRAISFREWIHRPFLYYIIHRPPSDPIYDQVMPLAQKCLELCVQQMIRTFGNHRHHGTWYVSRVCIARALLLLAAARSGKISLPEDWKEALEIARGTVRRWCGEATDLRWAEAIFDDIARVVVE